MRGIQCATQAAVESFAACLRQEMKPRNVAISVVATGEFAPGNAWLNETELREQVCVMNPRIFDHFKVHCYIESHSL